MEPILCPASTHSSTLLPATHAPRNPPANASPAPFVSTISSSLSGCTAYTLGLSGLSDETTTVDSAPWVMTTMRGRDALDLGSIAMALATAGMFLGSGRPLAVAHASASASLPMMMSQYGMICCSWLPKNCGMNGAEKLIAKTCSKLVWEANRVEVDAINLGRGRCLLAEVDDTLNSVGQEVSLDIEDLGAFHQGRDNLGLEVGFFKFLGHTQCSHKRTGILR